MTRAARAPPAAARRRRRSSCPRPGSCQCRASRRRGPAPAQLSTVQTKNTPPSHPPWCPHASVCPAGRSLLSRTLGPPSNIFAWLHLHKHSCNSFTRRIRKCYNAKVYSMPGVGWLEAGGCHLETEEEGEGQHDEDDEGAHPGQQHRARARTSRVSCNNNTLHCRVERETNLSEN